MGVGAVTGNHRVSTRLHRALKVGAYDHTVIHRDRQVPVDAHAIAHVGFHTSGQRIVGHGTPHFNRLQNHSRIGRAAGNLPTDQRAGLLRSDSPTERGSRNAPTVASAMTPARTRKAKTYDACSPTRGRAALRDTTARAIPSAWVNC